MSRPKNKLRYLQVVTLREGGRTYEEIGARLEPPVTYQRVRQILRHAGRSDLCNQAIQRARQTKPRRPCRTCGKPVKFLASIYCSKSCEGLDRRHPNGITAKAEAALPLRAKGVSWNKIAEILQADKWSLYSVCKRVIRSRGQDPDEHWAFYRLRPPGRPPRRRRAGAEARS